MNRNILNFTGFAGGMILISSLFLLGGCDNLASDPQHQPPQAIGPADECHLCGMLIKKFPGPKGEAYQRGDSQVKKFCSTMDLFSYWLQPENQVNVQTVYVHDMARSPWQQPDDAHFTDARTAWYVIGHRERGAMGATLASFANREEAEKFAAPAGGKLVRFGEITLEMLSALSSPKM